MGLFRIWRGWSVPERSAWLFTLLGVVGWLGPAPARGAVFDFSAPIEEVEAGYSLGLVSYSVHDPAQNRDIQESVATPPPGVISTNNGTVAWSAGGTVYCRVYDPGRTNWMGTEVSAGSALTLLDSRGVVAWTTGNAVHAQVYEPTLGQWMGAVVASGQTFNLRNERGVVSWSSGDLVNYLAYDPVRRQWIGDSATTGATYDLSNRDGVVAWSSGGTIYYAVYDPFLGRWVRESATTGTTASLRNDSGVVAWTSSNVVYCRVYDPLVQQWRPESVLQGFPNNLSITNGVVRWSIAGGTLTRGYNPASQQWTNRPTPPLPWFAVSTNAGPAPLRVRFVDMSIGGGTWFWNFGDGGFSTRHAPPHTYTGFGGFTATLRLVNPHGEGTVSTNILTDVEPPVGSVVINDGALLTTNREVTLTLEATDNSGVVAAMRLRNADEDWGDWQSFAPEQAWQLSEGDGPKSVEVQFRDAVLNVSDTATAGIELDTTPLPDANFQFSATNVTEDIGTLAIPVELSHPFQRTVQVRCATTGGTAVPGEDYVPLDVELTFFSGFTIAEASLQILPNQVSQPNRTVELTLSNVTNAVPGGPLRVTILDDDPVGVRFPQAEFEVTEGESGAAIPVVLENPSGLLATVDYRTTEGTAVPGQDYQPVSGRLTFPPDTTEAQFLVPIIDNPDDQGDRTVGLELFAPTNAVLRVPSQAVLTIHDNDPPTVNFAQAEYRFAGVAGPAAVAVNLSKPPSATVLVDYATVAGGSAVAGVDFVVASDTLVFAPGKTSREFVLTVLANPDRTEARTIWLELKNALGATLGPSKNAVLRLEPPADLRVENPRLLEDGRFRMEIVSTPGERLQVLATQDFLVWRLMDEVVNPSGRLTWTEPAPAGLDFRYYRVRLAP